MAKRSLKLKVRLPKYQYPRNAWRRAIHKVVTGRMKRTGIRYMGSDRLEVYVRLYFDTRKLRLMDVDNRLKDVMDALQGHIGGGRKKRRMANAIIPNDSQIYRVTVDKGLPPGQSHGMGHLIIRKYRGPTYG